MPSCDSASDFTAYLGVWQWSWLSETGYLRGMRIPSLEGLCWVGLQWPHMHDTSLCHVRRVSHVHGEKLGLFLGGGNWLLDLPTCRFLRSGAKAGLTRSYPNTKGPKQGDSIIPRACARSWCQKCSFVQRKSWKFLENFFYWSALSKTLM